MKDISPQIVEQIVNAIPFNCKNLSIDLNVAMSKHGIYLNKLIIPKQYRSRGVGSFIVKEICNIADRDSLPVYLSLATRRYGWGTTSKARLRKFYGLFGFVTTETVEGVEMMARTPRKQIGG